MPPPPPPAILTLPADSTHGLVKYLPKAAAQATNLSYVQSDGQFVMRVDTTEIQTEGRPSVRITSNQTYGDGVYVLNATHVPTGCSVWPSWWMVPPDTQNYPQGGEIDIFENANVPNANQTGGQFDGNLVSLHTGGSCTFETSQQNQTGITDFTNCTVDYATGNNGCRVEMNHTTALGSKSIIPTTGPKLNQAQGGLFAMERNLSSGGTGIRVWYFQHDNVPDNLKPGSPSVDTSTWGVPSADFPVASCASQFGNMSLVFTNTLCGDWAGNTYNISGCNKYFPSCAFQVGQNGSSYSEAYWTVNDVRAFAKSQDGSGGSSGNDKEGAAIRSLAPISIALAAAAMGLTTMLLV